MFFDRDVAFRLNDTGVVTTVERLTFASLHFDVFKDLSVETNLIDFDIYYYKIEDCKINNAKKIEKNLLELFQPSCNFIKNRTKSIADLDIKTIKTKIDNLIFNSKINSIVTLIIIQVSINKLVFFLRRKDQFYIVALFKFLFINTF